MNNDYGDFLKTKKRERLERVSIQMMDIAYKKQEVLRPLNVDIVFDALTLAKELIKQLDEDGL